MPDSFFPRCKCLATGSANALSALSVDYFHDVPVFSCCIEGLLKNPLLRRLGRSESQRPLIASLLCELSGKSSLRNPYPPQATSCIRTVYWLYCGRCSPITVARSRGVTFLDFSDSAGLQIASHIKTECI